MEPGTASCSTGKLHGALDAIEYHLAIEVVLEGIGMCLGKRWYKPLSKF